MLPENSTKNNRVILIHGMWMSAFSMRFIGNQLAKKGWEVIYYDYSSMFTDFEQNVDRLYALWQKYKSDDTHLIGHSLGGLLVLAMMNKYHLKNLPRTVLMGCPINGSAVVKKMLPTMIGKAMLGKSALALLAGGEDIQSNRIGVIIGTRGIGMGHMIQRLPKPHDGVVASEEAEFTNAEDRIQLPVTHASMLISRKVSDAIDRYLCSGGFEV